MKKHVKFKDCKLNTGIMDETAPKNRLFPIRSYGHGHGGFICEKTTDSRVKRSSPGYMKDPVIAISIPTTLAEAPFLQHSRLTPGQKRYLCSIAGVCSEEHVWKLLQQHYMNVARRCIRAGLDSVTESSIKVSESLEPLPRVSQVSESETDTPKILKTPGQGRVNKEKNRFPKIDNQRKRASTKTVESKKGARKSKISGGQTNLKDQRSKGPSKSDIHKDTDDDDNSLDELIRALSLAEEEEDFFL